MTGLMRGLRGAVMLGMGVAVTGCSQLGGLENVLGGVLGPAAGSGNANASEVYGTVRGVDTQRQMIQIQTQNGQVGNIYFDQNTRVVYQNQQYPVTALEQGDQIGMRIQQAQNGNAYTDYITVTRSVQEANGGYSNTNPNGGYDNNTGGYNTGGYQQVEGRVTWVDVQRGQFGLTTNRGNLTVVMPYQSNANAANRFRNLRNNEIVRVEGQLVANGRLELSRFY
ncbi:MAG TPA: hypothetical protein VEX86_11920 [Longimicrobium sp.]|nr:hypothetical protein [Longimicrobium sp.]